MEKENLNNKVDHKEENKIEKNMEEKKEQIVKKIVKKEFAIVKGDSLHISHKNSYAICDVIRNKTIDKAIEFLEQVIIKKKAVPMNNREIPHRKGNIMAGRYPQNATKVFIDLLKQLKANSSVNNIENPYISKAIANRASRPFKRGGKKAKRTNVIIESRTKKTQEKK
jgi:ribosomal protein L22